MRWLKHYQSNVISPLQWKRHSATCKWLNVCLQRKQNGRFGAWHMPDATSNTSYVSIDICLIYSVAVWGIRSWLPIHRLLETAVLHHDWGWVMLWEWHAAGPLDATSWLIPRLSHKYSHIHYVSFVFTSHVTKGFPKSLGLSRLTSLHSQLIKTLPAAHDD